jgi:membrane protein YdbS with pleckstrin-like domain
MRFRSAVDTWFYLFALVLPLLILVAVALVTGIAHIEVQLMIFLATVIALGLPLWMWLGTWYDVDSDRLLIRSGPLRWSIPISSIRSVEASRSLLASPGLSLRRLKIRYGHQKSILVSPKDVPGFRKALGFMEDKV